MPIMSDIQCEDELLDDVLLNRYNHFGLYKQSERRFVVIGMENLTPINYSNLNARVVENYHTVDPLTKPLAHWQAIQVLGFLQAERARRRGEEPPKKR